jgi:CheY-like chemotaxis protein
MTDLLVVEDDPQLSSLLEDIFRDEGYTVRTAEHGRDAMAMVLTGYEPEVLIVDVMMPVMDGITFLASYKRAKGHHPRCVVVLSGVGGTLP